MERRFHKEFFGTLELGGTFVREALLHSSGGLDMVLCFSLDDMAKHFYACSLNFSLLQFGSRGR